MATVPCRLGCVLAKVHAVGGVAQTPLWASGFARGLFLAAAIQSASREPRRSKQRLGHPTAMLRIVNLDRHCLSQSGQAVAHPFDVRMRAVPSRPCRHPRSRERREAAVLDDIGPRVSFLNADPRLLIAEATPVEATAAAPIVTNPGVSFGRPGLFRLEAAPQRRTTQREDKPGLAVQSPSSSPRVIREPARNDNG